MKEIKYQLRTCYASTNVPIKSQNLRKKKYWCWGTMTIRNITNCDCIDSRIIDYATVFSKN